MEHTNGHRPDAFDPRLPFSRAEARCGRSVDQDFDWQAIPEDHLGQLSRSWSEDHTTDSKPGGGEARAIRITTSATDDGRRAVERARGPGGPVTHLTTPSAEGRIVRKGIKSHYYDSHLPMTTMRSGLPVSTPEQVLLDLATVGMPLVDLVVVLDGMLKAEHTTPEALVKAAESWSGRGRQLALRAASLARVGVDSPMRDQTSTADRSRRLARASSQPRSFAGVRRSVAAAVRSGL